MVIEWHSDLDSAQEMNPALRVPGLAAEGMAGAVVWQARGVPPGAVGDERPDAALVAAIQGVSAAWSASGTHAAWASTVVAFPSHWQAFVDAGWVTPPDTPAVAGPWRSRSIWTRLPSPASPAWQRFWSVPLDPVPTTVVALGGCPPGLLPPDGCVSMATAAPAAFAPWAWMGDAAARERWLGAVSDHLVGLALGIEECRVGVQFVVPRAGMERLRSALEPAVG